MRRLIARHGPLDPDFPERTIYVLECGHSISRRTKSDKRWAICGHCQREQRR